MDMQLSCPLVCEQLGTRSYNSSRVCKNSMATWLICIWTCDIDSSIVSHEQGTASTTKLLSVNVLEPLAAQEAKNKPAPFSPVLIGWFSNGLNS